MSTYDVRRAADVITPKRSCQAIVPKREGALSDTRGDAGGAATTEWGLAVGRAASRLTQATSRAALRLGAHTKGAGSDGPMQHDPASSRHDPQIGANLKSSSHSCRCVGGSQMCCIIGNKKERCTSRRTIVRETTMSTPPSCFIVHVTCRKKAPGLIRERRG